jgi:tripartite ATP-independent transporter DctM subunit
MSPAIVALIIAVALVGSLFTGLPVFACLIGISMICSLIFVGPAALYMAAGSAIGQITTEVYLAIMLFVFMAAVMQNSGMGQQLYDAMAQWLGRLRGGLAMATIGACAIIAALSGIGATGTTMMGMVALPEMYKRGYSKRMVLGTIAAGGALGPLIPPSVLMIIVGGYTDLSVARLFAGGVVPGLLVAFTFCLYIGIRCVINKEDGPALSKEETLSFIGKIKASKYVIAPIIMIIILLVGIYGGICTPTEAGCIGALGSLIISIANGKLSWNNFSSASLITVKVTCMVMWVLIGGGCYSALVTSSGTGTVVSSFMASLHISPFGILAIFLVLAFILGMFIDAVAIAMICLPILLPMIKGTEVDLLWAMLLFCICLILGYMTPPFGLNLFYMKGCAPNDTKMIDIYMGILPFVIVETAILVLCFVFPPILVWLPSLIK